MQDKTGINYENKIITKLIDRCSKKKDFNYLCNLSME